MLLEHGMDELTGGAVSSKHQNRIFQKFLKRQGLVFQFSIIFPAGNKTVVKFSDITDVEAVIQPGVGIVGKDQIHRTVFQQIHASNGSLVGDLDMDSL